MTIQMPIIFVGSDERLGVWKFCQGGLSCADGNNGKGGPGLYGVETERREDTTGYVIVYHRDWYPIEEYMNRHVTLRYGETSIQIYSDYVTGWVTEISLLGEQDMAVTFLRKMLQTHAGRLI